MTRKNDPFDWERVENKESWLIPCEESYYYADKWKREGIRSVLDLGCGLGRHALLFAQNGFKVTGVDISQVAVDSLKGLSREKGVDILCRCADMSSLPFADSAFGAVFAMHSAGHTDSKGMKILMQEIRRVLKPNGTVFMTLCSKETYSYTQGSLPRVDENTLIKTTPPEEGVMHYFADRENIEELFADFELTKVRHIDDCFYDGRWKNEKHYFIEARCVKADIKPDYSKILGSTVRGSIDRPKGTEHPRIKGLIYHVNYGYVDGVFAGDGAEQDIYYLGEDKPVKSFEGKVIAVYHRLNDNEDKWIVAKDGCKFTKEQILESIYFQERFFDGEIYMAGEEDV